jgi:hypothetical protein
LGGLRDGIANSVKMFKPQTLRETIQLARMQEDRMNRAKPFFQGEKITTYVKNPI